MNSEGSAQEVVDLGGIDDIGIDECWQLLERAYLVKIIPDEITGRRIRLAGVVSSSDIRG